MRLQITDQGPKWATEPPNGHKPRTHGTYCLCRFTNAEKRENERTSSAHGGQVGKLHPGGGMKEEEKHRMLTKLFLGTQIDI